MSSVNRMLKQKAVYWAFSSFGNDGDITYADPVEIACRWENKAEEYLDPGGTKSVSRSVVYVAEDVAPKGVLFLGELSEVASGGPFENEGAMEIKQFDKIPDLKGNAYCRIAYL